MMDDLFLKECKEELGDPERHRQAFETARDDDGAVNLPRLVAKLNERKTAKHNQMQEEGKNVQIDKVIQENPLLKDLQMTGLEDDEVKRVMVVDHLMRKGGYSTIKPLLPMFLALKGKPFHLREQFPFEPLFATRMPQALCVKSGRQLGKCSSVRQAAAVTMHNGRRAKGLELKVGDKILSLGEHYRCTVVTVVAKTRLPSRQVYKVRTLAGVELEVAATHPFRTTSGWTQLSALSVTDRICAIFRGGEFLDKLQPPSRIVLTAYLVGAGNVCDEGFSLASSCQDVLQEASDVYFETTGLRPQDSDDGLNPHHTSRQIHFSRKTVCWDWLVEDGLAGRPTREKFIPDWVYDLSEEDTRLFISRIWATNGSVREEDADRIDISYSSPSRRLVFDLKSLLMKFGIRTAVTSEVPLHVSKKTGDRVDCRPSWNLRVETRESWKRFMELFDVPGKPAVPIPKTGSASEQDPLPPDGDVFWDEIVSIEEAGEQECWDIEVTGDANYCLDGIVSHNSTGLAAQGVMFSNCIPFFTTLYILPLFEMVRRFSANYVKPFVESSPIGKVFNSKNVVNSVLERTFHNQAKMQFSFAFLSAERIRGISADRVSLDETVCGTTTYVKTLSGVRQVKYVNIGEFVETYCPDGRRDWARVVNSVYHGKQHCFKLTTKSGKSLTLTAGSRLPTTGGYRYVSDIIDQFAKAIAAGEPAWGRRSEVPPDSGQPAVLREHVTGVSSRLDPASVQPGEVHDFVRVRRTTSKEGEEQRLRQMVELLPSYFQSGIELFTRPVSAVQHQDQVRLAQNGDSRLVEGDRESRTVGSGCLVDRGRRRSFVACPGERCFSENDDSYRRLLETGSCDALPLAGSTRDRGVSPESSQPPQPGEALLAHRNHCTGDNPSRREDQAAHACGDELQGYSVSATGRGGVLLVRPDFSTRQAERRIRQEPEQSQNQHVEDLLSEKGMPTCEASASLSELDVASRKARKPQSARSRTLSCRSGEESRTFATHGNQASRDASGQRQGSETTLSREKTGGAAGSALDLSTLRTDRTTRDTRLKDQILYGLSREDYLAAEAGTLSEGPERRERAAGDPAADLPGLPCSDPGCASRQSVDSLPYVSESTHRSSAKTSISCDEGQKLAPDELVSIEYAGLRDVFDLEVEGTHTFVANGIGVKNCQDIDFSFLPVIFETMSASEHWSLKQYTGTPKTFDGTLERVWSDSSRAEWFIKCHHGGCGYWNIPSLEHDLLAMIGPYREDISEEYPGVVCAKCRKPLRPRPVDQGGYGRYVHAVRDRRWDATGLHIPQIIMPMHYANKKSWSILLAKQAGRGNTPIHTFLNEVCGESYDAGAKLLTISDIRRAASLPWPCDRNEALKHVNEYEYRIVSVDWGGGGRRRGISGEDDKSLFTSYTVAAVMGITSAGEVHVLYGVRSTTPHDFSLEADLVMRLLIDFQAHRLVHDFTGAGALREHIIHDAGYPAERIVPIAYTGPTKGGILNFKEATALQPRSHYSCDKSRSLQMTCELYKACRIKTFQDDYLNAEESGLLRDFLSLITEKSDSRSGRDLYRIYCDPNGTDDFAQAVNIGAMALYNMTDKWPDLGSSLITYPSELIDRLNPQQPLVLEDWELPDGW